MNKAKGNDKENDFRVKGWGQRREDGGGGVMKAQSAGKGENAGKNVTGKRNSAVAPADSNV